RERASVAGASGAGAGRRIEAGAVGLALDLSRLQPEAAVAHVDRLEAMGADVEIGANGSGRVQHRESFLPFLPQPEPDRALRPQLDEVEQLHFAGTQGISLPPARRLAAR